MRSGLTDRQKSDIFGDVVYGWSLKAVRSGVSFCDHEIVVQSFFILRYTDMRKESYTITDPWPLVHLDILHFKKVTPTLLINIWWYIRECRWKLTKFVHRAVHKSSGMSVHKTVEISKFRDKTQSTFWLYRIYGSLRMTILIILNGNPRSHTYHTLYKNVMNERFILMNVLWMTNPVDLRENFIAEFTPFDGG